MAQKKENKVIKNLPRQKLSADELSTLPFPDRDLYSKYDYFKDYPFVTFVGSRGCPFKCSFCEMATIAGFEVLKPEETVDHLEEMANRGAKHYRFFKDLFNFYEKYNA